MVDERKKLIVTLFVCMHSDDDDGKGHTRKWMMDVVVENEQVCLGKVMRGRRRKWIVKAKAVSE